MECLELIPESVNYLVGHIVSRIGFGLGQGGT